LPFWDVFVSAHADLIRERIDGAVGE